MDKDTLRKQILEEVHAQFDAKLREAKRQKGHAEEELESASERWRNERRRLNSEIDRLEAALAESKENPRRKAASAKTPANEAAEITRIKTAAEEKLRKATATWEADRAKLVSQIARLERAVAETIERSNNPLRSTQPIKEQFEARLQQVSRERTELEKMFLRAKSDWEEEKKKLTGEMIKLRRLAPNSKALEAKEKLERMQGKTQSLEVERIRELEAKLSEAHSEMQKMHERLSGAREEARHEYEPRLEEFYKLRVETEEKLRVSTKEWASERHQLSAEIAELQQKIAHVSAKHDDNGTAPRNGDHASERSSNKKVATLERQIEQLLAEKEERELARVNREKQLLQEAGFQLEESRRTKAAAEERLKTEQGHWQGEREQLQQELQQLKQVIAENQQKVSVENDELRVQYDEKLREIIQQKSQLAKELQAANALLKTERDRFSKESGKSKGGSGKTPGLDSETISSEVTRIQDKIQQITALIDDPDTELSTVIRKNVEKAELDAYLKGILFSLGKGQPL
jgi:hypothetical protein